MCSKIMRSSTLSILNSAEITSGAVISTLNRIHSNLALETYICDVLRPKVPLLLWWRNHSCVVIGRNQNPWVECNLPRMARDGVDLARRYTGGGAVYQDLGNYVMTFIVPLENFSVERNEGLVLHVLKNHFNINASSSGRNDLIIDGKKFSGCAIRRLNDYSGATKGWAIHHLTLLVNVNMDAIQTYLTPTPAKLKSKGIQSVRSRVVNLCEVNPSINYESMEGAFVTKFFEVFDKKNVATESQVIISIDKNNDVFQELEYQKQLTLLQDWSWVYGSAPCFTHRLEHCFSWGSVDLHIDVSEGIVRSVKMFTDALHVELTAHVESALRKQKFTLKSMKAVASSMESFMDGASVPGSVRQITNQFFQWFIERLKEIELPQE